MVVVPFPFTDQAQTKKRPAIVLSETQHQSDSKHVTLLMITSGKNSEWSSDYLIEHLKTTGLHTESIVRQKIFTIDERLIIKSIGHIHQKDRDEILKKIQHHLAV